VSGTLWTTRRDRRRLRKARSAVLMVGSYDGSGNFGDVLQLAGAIQTVASLPGSPLPVAIIERGFHSRLLERYPEQLGGAVYATYDGGTGPPPGRLVELAPGIAPEVSVLYLYGGGYLNHWWAGRKLALSEAAEQLGGGGPLPLVASGQQVEETTIAAGGATHELISRAAWVGARDAGSLEALRANLPQGADRIVLSGDDALPLLDLGPAVPEDLVNLHLNGGDWVSDEAEAMIGRVIAIVRRLGEASSRPLELQPVVAYEDDRVSEASLISEVLGRHRDDLGQVGVTPITPLEVLADASHNGLAGFRRARLTVSCSYHVALTSLLAGIPTMLLAGNRYYEQKSAGLRDLFGLDEGLVGVAGGETDAEAAVAVLADGPARTALVERIRAGAARTVERCNAGRGAAAAALAEALDGVVAQPGGT
jgi:Polysaccharide pyruvyl transferase